MFLFHSQVASARLRGIERPQFIGSSIETLLFGTFFYLVTQRKNLKDILQHFGAAVAVAHSSVHGKPIKDTNLPKKGIRYTGLKPWHDDLPAMDRGSTWI